MINQIEPLIEQIDIDAVTSYMKSGGWITEHKVTAELEQKIANYLGVNYCIMTTSGTSALLLAFDYVSLFNKGKALVPDYTMIASANAPKYLGFDVELFGVKPDTLGDFEDLKNKVDNDSVIVYPTLNGRAGDIERVREFCDNESFFLIEDACQSFGSTFNGKKLGTFGDIGCFSLSPHKIITTGQGGFLVTNNKHINDTIRKLKNFGRYEEGIDNFEFLGINHKFTDLQATLGISQLSTIEKRVAKKKHIYREYYKNLFDCPDLKIIERDSETTPWFVDVVFTKKKAEEIIAVMKDTYNIQLRPFYPPLHTQPPYNTKAYDFKFVEELSEKGAYLPSLLTLQDETIKYICECLSKAAA